VEDWRDWRGPTHDSGGGVETRGLERAGDWRNQGLWRDAVQPEETMMGFCRTEDHLQRSLVGASWRKPAPAASRNYWMFPVLEALPPAGPRCCCPPFELYPPSPPLSYRPPLHLVPLRLPRQVNRHANCVKPL
jgi:hypothetical protein